MITFESVLTICFIILILFSLKRNVNEEFFSKKHTQYLRGIFAAFIMIFHISKENDILFPFLEYLSIVVVGAFFFLSGYGLFKSYLGSNNFRETFIKRRIVKIVIPYIIATLIYWLYHSLIGNHYTVLDIIKSIISFGPIVMYSWFIVSLIVQYTMFYIIIALCKNTKRVLMVVVILMLVRIVLLMSGVSYVDVLNEMTCFGILFANYDVRIMRFVKNKRMLIFLLSLALTLLMSIDLLSFREVPVLFNVIEKVLFIFMIIIFSTYYTFENAFIGLLGKISFELYMFSGLSKMIIRRFLDTSVFIQDFAIYILAIVLSIVLHSFFNIISNQLSRN